MMGIASGGEVTFRATNEVILRSTLLGIDAKARSLSFKAAYLKQGQLLLTADVTRDMNCKVTAVVFNGSLRSEYSSSRATPLPLITTIDITTGKILSRTSNPELLRGRHVPRRRDRVPGWEGNLPVSGAATRTNGPPP